MAAAPEGLAAKALPEAAGVLNGLAAALVPPKGLVLLELEPNGLLEAPKALLEGVEPLNVRKEDESTETKQASQGVHKCLAGTVILKPAPGPDWPTLPRTHIAWSWMDPKTQEISVFDI